MLDSLPLNPGDLDGRRCALGDLTLHDNTAPDEVVARIRDADVLYTNKVRLNAAAFEAAPHLRLVSVLATGYDIVDVEAARRHGVIVCNVPGYGTDSVAQTTIALLLELTHHAGAHDRAVRDGEWSRINRFSFWAYPLVELASKTMLIVGLGAIGARVAQIAAAFGMTVSAAELPGRPGSSQHDYPRLAWREALPQADVVSLHCPLTPATRAIINAESITLMKPTALLINTARGLLVDEAALATALHEDRIGGYAADVLNVEPPSPNNPLLHAPRTILTPHLGWASFESRQRLMAASVGNLRAFLTGQARNVVS